MKNPTPEELDEMLCCTIGIFGFGTVTLGAMLGVSELLIRGKKVYDKMRGNKQEER